MRRIIALALFATLVTPAFAQEESAQVRAGLVVKEGVVQACRPHLRRYRDFRRLA